MKEFDYIVIGGGSGGIASANRAAMYGAKVAVIEGNLLGGTCVNRGCVPKKITWYAAKVADAIQTYGPGYGFDTTINEFNYQTFKVSRDAYIERSRNSYNSQFKKNMVTHIEGYARFISNHEIEVNGERYTAQNILIATGGKPAELKVKGAEFLDNSDTFFEWNDLPKSVAIVGAGYIAVELAQALNALGVETHLVVRHDRPLRTFDKMLTDLLVEEIQKQGIHLHTHTNIDEYRLNHDHQIECFENEQLLLTVDRVIQAIGRRPNTDQLGLENTDIARDDKGWIQVKDSHETTVKGIYAIGDIINKINLTPVAIRAGRQLSEYLFNKSNSSEIDYNNVPTVIFSHPAIGKIGLTESEAIEQYGQSRIKIYQSRFYSMYASAGNARQACDFKLVCLDKEEKIIGLHGIGEGVDEMIQGFGVAIKMGARKQDFDQVIAIHPTGAEEFVTMR